MKVLIVKTSSMGDVIHTFPALTDAVRARADLIIDWCVEAPFASLVKLHPSVRQVHPVAVRRWRRRLGSAQTRAQIGQFKRAVRQARYDLVIDAQGLMKSAALARLAGAPVAGLDRRSAREPLAALLYASRCAIRRDMHAIDRLRQLFGQVLDYQPDLEQLDYGLQPAPRSAGPANRVFLLHGTTWPSKRWHLEGWIELAQALTARGITPVVTHANDDEQQIAHAIAHAVNATEIIEPCDLADLARHMAGATAAIGTDTGLTHLACALDLPTVQIALSTAPDLTGPRGNRVDVIEAEIACAPCRKRECPLVPLGVVQPCAPTISAGAILNLLDAMR